MTAAPVLRAASGGITRRLVQTAVVFVVLTASTAAALLGMTLLSNANELFYSAVAAQHGADLAVTVNAARVSPMQLAATRGAAGVTQAAGLGIAAAGALLPAGWAAAAQTSTTLRAE